MLLFLLLLILTFAVIFYLLRPTKTETAVQQHLQDIKVARAEETGQTILKEEGYSRNPEVTQLIRQVPGALGTLNLLRQSGQTWTVSSVMGISVAATLVVAWITSLFLPSVILAMIAGVVAGSIPYIYLIVMRELRFRKCDELLPVCERDTRSQR
jgi:Flp pilus assembly protein TadB